MSWTFSMKNSGYPPREEAVDLLRGRMLTLMSGQEHTEAVTALCETLRIALATVCEGPEHFRHLVGMVTQDLLHEHEAMLADSARPDMKTEGRGA